MQRSSECVSVIDAWSGIGDERSAHGEPIMMKCMNGLDVLSIRRVKLCERNICVRSKRMVVTGERREDQAIKVGSHVEGRRCHRHKVGVTTNEDLLHVIASNLEKWFLGSSNLPKLKIPKVYRDPKSSHSRRYSSFPNRKEGSDLHVPSTCCPVSLSKCFFYPPPSLLHLHSLQYPQPAHHSAL
jgi:hypothetical protein